MRIITYQDIKSLDINPSLCFEWAEEMIMNKHESILPPKFSMVPFAGAFCNVMPSMVLGPDSKKRCGVKVVIRYPGRIPSLESQILLLDAESGEFLALMDGTWITAMRTGAVAAHSILHFAKSHFSTIGIMGLGNVSRSTLLILLEKLPDRELYIKLLKYKNQEDDFYRRFKEYKNIHFSFVETPEEMIKNSDIVISGATYLPNNVCSDEFFDEGVLVQPIHTMGFLNCDLFFDKVFVDDIGHVKNFKNFDKFRQVSEVCEVVNGNKPGRESDQERILAYNVGISIHDICFASNLYQLMKERGIISTLPVIDMKVPKDKFWI